MSAIRRDLTAVLPNGKDFVFWEREQSYDRELHVSAEKGSDAAGDGSKKAPFATIGAAAAIASAGTKVLIHAGVYRECVRPARGGDGAERMICYESAGDGEVAIKASEAASGFAESVEYAIEPDDDGTVPVVWEHSLDREMFHGYNPFGVINCIHERNWLHYSKVEKNSSLEPYFMRRGMVYSDGTPLRQVPLYRMMRNTPGSYWVEENGLKVHFRMPDNGSPEGHVIEVSCREQCFVPAKPFQSYIKVKGLTFLHAANGAPVPQIGALSLGRGHHWIIEDCTVRWANATGFDIGNEGWSFKRNPGQQIGYAVVRNCRILDCGVCGIAGIGTSYTLIEDNLFARNGWQHMEQGWESGDLKFHNCQDSLFRRNIFRDSDMLDALWLDCNNYNDRITQNLFMNVRAPHGMIFMECNRGGAVPREILIDNNILWNSKFYTEPEARKTGITIDSTEWNDPFDLSDPVGDGIIGYGSDDMHIVNNLIANVDGFGYNQNIVRGRMANGRGGTARNSVVMNNVFYDCRSGAVRLPNHDNTFDGNYYAKMPEGFLTLTYPAPTERHDLVGWRRFEGQDLHGGYAAFKLDIDPDEMTLTVRPASKSIAWDRDNLETEGYASMSKVAPDKSVATDYFGNVLDGARMPGPFDMDSDEVTINIDPRKKRA